MTAPTAIAELQPAEIQALRKKLCRSTHEFTARFGIPTGTITNWEQGRRRPDPAATLALRLIEAFPDQVEAFLAGKRGAEAFLATPKREAA